jgi:hypothetical protein
VVYQAKGPALAGPASEGVEINWRRQRQIEREGELEW